MPTDAPPTIPAMSASGTIARSYTYYKFKKTTHTRKNLTNPDGSPKTYKTPNRIIAYTLYNAPRPKRKPENPAGSGPWGIHAAWLAMSQPQHETWKPLAKRLQLPPYTAFLSTNMKRHAAGLPIITSPP